MLYRMIVVFFRMLRKDKLFWCFLFVPPYAAYYYCMEYINHVDDRWELNKYGY